MLPAIDPTPAPTEEKCITRKEEFRQKICKQRIYLLLTEIAHAKAAQRHGAHLWKNEGLGDVAHERAVVVQIVKVKEPQLPAALANNDVSVIGQLPSRFSRGSCDSRWRHSSTGRRMGGNSP